MHAFSSSSLPAPLTKPRRAGFTLIELSIVLVVIALVAAGVTVGVSLRNNYKLMTIVSDAEQIRSDILSFKAQYNYYPGDFPNATSMWAAMTAPACDNTGDASNGSSSTALVTLTCNGRGNGVIGQYYANAALFPTAGADMRELREKFYIWQHLNLAGYIDQSFSGYSAVAASNDTVRPGVNIPTTDYSAAMGFSIAFWPNNYTSQSATRTWPVQGKIGHLFSWSTPSVGVVTANLITSPDAAKIDGKIDDGLPFSGQVFAQGREVGDPHGVSGCTSGTDYVSTSINPCGQYYRNFLETP